MILSFKQFCEDFFDTPVGQDKDQAGSALPMAGIFKNPTSSEWSKIPADAKGFATRDGDLLLAADRRTTKGLHKSMVRSIRSLGLVNADKKLSSFFSKNQFAVSIQRIEKSMFFALGEASFLSPSTGAGNIPKAKPPSDEKLKDVKMILKKVRKKNPRVRFLLKNINDIRTDHDVERV